MRLSSLLQQCPARAQIICIRYKYIKLGLMSRVLANCPGDWCLILCRVKPKTQKMVLDATQHYKVSIKGKVEQYREGVAPYPTPRCSSI